MFNYNGSTYLLTNFGTWEQAQAQAQSLGGNLVTINTAAEQNWLVSTFGGTEQLWIGLTDKVIEGQFKWASNEISTYINWFPGQPDNGGPQGEDYVVMNFGAAGKWNDYPDPNTLVPPTAFRGIIEITSSTPTPTITLAVLPSTVIEDGTTNLIYIFTRTGATTNPLTVSYSITGTANSSDYTGATPGTGKTITFGAGSSTAILTIDPTADTTVESDETVALTLASGTGYNVGTTTAVTGTILNDDSTNPIFNYNGSQYTLTSYGTWQEAQAQAQSLGGNLVTINNQAEQDWLVNTFGVNQTLWIGLTDEVTEGQFKWVSGEISTYTNWLPGEPNNGWGGEDYVEMNFGSPGKWNDSSSNQFRRGIIEITSSTPTITLAVLPSSVLEDGTTNLTYIFTRTGATTNPLTVSYSITGTANSSDYTGATPGTGKTITFAAGSSTAILTIDPTADTTVESDETVALTLASGTGYTVGTTTAVTGTILNDDSTNPIFNYNGSQYLLTNFGTWEQAQAQALSLGGNLVTINTAAEQNFLVSAFGGNEQLWIGLTDKVIEGQFKWASNEISTYINWFPGQPDNGGPQGEDYVVMNFGAAGKWNDYPNNLSPFRGIIEIRQSVSPINGTSGNDTLNGTNGHDILNGLSGNDRLNGGLGNDTLNGGLGTDTLIGGAGDDIYVVDAITDIITESLNAGTDTIQSSVTYTIANLTNIENLTLTGTTAISGTGNTGNNVITGNIANNTLNGGAGNDKLSGGAGIDTLIGGAGNDIYVVDTTTDTITEGANAGTDTIESSVTYTIATLTNIENLTLTGTAAINGTGNAGNNVITGNIANNILNGGLGTDTLIGGAGDDTYIVDTITDTITELVGGGIDTIQSGVTYTIATLTNIENLTLTGTAINGTGNTGDNVITGNDANNNLNGGAGNDKLNGGAGIDTLIGGAGNDIYVVDTTTDTITEGANAGTDTIQSSVTYTIATVPLTNIENLTLTGTAAINGTGNAGNNVITGNIANNILNGGAGNDTLNGGEGTDTLIGGAGNDTYVVDTTTDTIIESPNAGTDTIESSVSFSIAALANVENLTLTGTATDATGNDGNNLIIGNDGNNTFDGGLGDDTLDGGAGDDTYIFTINGIGLGRDTITDGSGVDTISFAGTSANIRLNLGTGLGQTVDANTNTKVVLAAADAIENATGGDGNDRLIGNSLDNTLEGGLGNDILNGSTGNDFLFGGDGNDSLTGGDGDDTLTGGLGTNNLLGGTGSDQFVFSGVTPFNTIDNGVDIIADFSTGIDKLVLSKTVFDFLSSDVGIGLSDTSDFDYVEDDEFAGDSNARIVYSLTSGSLFYNQDGATAGFGTGGEFAVVDLVTANDFVIIA
jgi:Ca2+-binding RTX toxin-like protein